MGTRPPTVSAAVPVLPVRDIAAAVSLYRALGFTVEHYAGPDPYAFASRDGVRLHLAQVDGIDPSRSLVSVYLYVDDAAALHAEWQAAGVPGRLIAPRATGYRLLEGAYVDPDGSLIRFGSPMAGGHAEPS